MYLFRNSTLTFLLQISNFNIKIVLGHELVTLIANCGFAISIHLHCTLPPISLCMLCSFRGMENNFVDGISSSSPWLVATPVILLLHIKCRFLIKHNWLMVLLNGLSEWQDLSWLLLHLLLNPVALEVTVQSYPILFKWFSYEIIFFPNCRSHKQF